MIINQSHEVQIIEHLFRKEHLENIGDNTNGGLWDRVVITCALMMNIKQHIQAKSGGMGVSVSLSLNDYEVANMKSIQLINDNI